MKRYKRLAVFFGITTILLLCFMCYAYGYQYRELICHNEHGVTSFPPSAAIVVVIPFSFGILISIILALIFYQKMRRSQR